MSHVIIKCSCGKIIDQCRCMSKDKTVEIKENGCDECKSKNQPPQRKNDHQTTTLGHIYWNKED